MTIHRKSESKPSAENVTPRMVELFQLGLMLEQDGLDYEQDEYGHFFPADDFKKIDMELHALMGLQPWHPRIFDIVVDAEPPPGLPPIQLRHWKHVREWRRALVART